MNIYDISQRAGVSIATVSRVLNGSKRVSQATREKVERVIAECGYTPNAFARGLGLGSMRTVGLLCADFADPYLAQAVAYLEALLRARGYDCLLSGGERDAGIALLLRRHVDGMILVGSSLVESDMDRNAPVLRAARRLPVMILGAALAGPGVYAVFCDDRGATAAAVDALLAGGSRRILYLYHSASYSGLKKLQGYRDAVAGAGLPVREELIRLLAGARASPSAVRDALAQLRREGLDFDAVMTSDDQLALGALKYARQAGLAVPGELPVMGFNDSMLARSCEPELSSVDNRLHSQCLQCAECLARLLAGEEAPKRAVFAGELRLRGTTRPLPRAGRPGREEPIFQEG